MPITTDDDVPQECVDLFVAFTKLADGYDALIVMNAIINLAVCTINLVATDSGKSLTETVEMANGVAKRIILEVAENFDREPQPTDRIVTQTVKG